MPRTHFLLNKDPNVLATFEKLSFQEMLGSQCLNCILPNITIKWENLSSGWMSNHTTTLKVDNSQWKIEYMWDFPTKYGNPQCGDE